MNKKITVMLPVEDTLLCDFSEYCRDHRLTLVEGLIDLMNKATGNKPKRVKLKIVKEGTCH